MMIEMRMYTVYTLVHTHVNDIPKFIYEFEHAHTHTNVLQFNSELQEKREREKMTTTSKLKTVSLKKMK